MKIIFKFPFSAAGNTYPVALYAMDPQAKQDYRIFNITVIFENWPVEQIKSIPDQYFDEDDEKDKTPFDYPVTNCAGDLFMFHSNSRSSLSIFPVTVIVLIVVLVTLFFEVHVVQDCP